MEDFDRILDHLARHEVENPGQRLGEIIAAVEILEQNPDELKKAIVADALPKNIAGLQRDLGKYNRMFEMYSKIMANAHEMKKSLIANFPR